MATVFGSPPVTGLVTRRFGVMCVPDPNHGSENPSTIKVDARKNPINTTNATGLPAGAADDKNI